MNHPAGDLSRYDDLPVHQTAEPVSTPASGDPNIHERYLFLGADERAGVFFGLAFAVFPNREVIEASCAVLSGPLIHSVRASGSLAAGAGPAVGPLSLHIDEPMRRLAMAVDSRHLSVDLSFSSEAGAVPLPRVMRPGPTPTDLSRFGQTGTWTGTIHLPDATEQVDGWPAWRRRQWGHAPAGRRPEQGRPLTALPQEYHLCLAALAPTGTPRLTIDDGPGTPRPDYELALTPGTRVPTRLTMSSPSGEPDHFEPIMTLPAHLLGGVSADWPSGGWKGTSCVSHRTDPAGAPAPQPLDGVHHHQFGTIVGEGAPSPAFLETLILGEYPSLDLDGWADGAMPA